MYALRVLLLRTIYTCRAKTGVPILLADSLRDRYGYLYGLIKRAICMKELTKVARDDLK